MRGKRPGTVTPTEHLSTNTDDAACSAAAEVGGPLTPERVLHAYRRGVFPWPIDGENYWFSPDPRFVLYPDDLHVSRSLRQRIRSGRFEVRLDTAFDEILDGCTRPEGWITPEYRATYETLFETGHVHCAGAWREDRLVGGLSSAVARKRRIGAPPRSGIRFESSISHPSKPFAAIRSKVR